MEKVIMTETLIEGGKALNEFIIQMTPTDCSTVAISSQSGRLKNLANRHQPLLATWAKKSPDTAFGIRRFKQLSPRPTQYES